MRTLGRITAISESDRLCKSEVYGIPSPELCLRQPRRAASMVAMSIFLIGIIASKARFASPPPNPDTDQILCVRCLSAKTRPTCRRR